MRILHTADWHMGDSLGRVDRSADIVRALEQIAAHLHEYQADVMIVAGDLFSERLRQERLRDAVHEIKRIFQPFLQRGGTILAISGNHDNEVFFETLRDALDLVAPGRQGSRETDPIGRLYVAPNPRIVCLADQAEAVVQFVLMPYPTARNYLRGDNIRYHTIEEKHRAIQQGFKRTLQTLASRVDKSLPTVLVSHIHVRGIAARSLRHMSESEDVIFEPGDVPTYWAYVAYGHIHQAQPAIHGAVHARYAGSIERLDAGERDDDKSVVLLDIGPAGLIGQPTLLPLDSTPILRVEITDPDNQVPQLSELYSDAARALIQYTLHWDPGKHNLDELSHAIQAVFPRWYDRKLIEIGGDRPREPTYSAQQIRDVVGTVRRYLDMRLSSHRHRDELRELAESLLAEEGWR